jgi:hypothetical protein
VTTNVLTGEAAMLKDKREGSDIGFKGFMFIGTDGAGYLAFRSLDGSFHAFAEVEAKQLAGECGAAELANTRQMWESIWGNQP